MFWSRGADGFDAVTPRYMDDLAYGEYYQPAGQVHDLNVTLSVPNYGGPRALLPHGFSLWYEHGDQHLFQAGIDLGTPTFSADSVSWVSHSLLKDDDDAELFRSAVAVDVMSGRSVLTYQPTVVSHLVYWLGRPRWMQEPVSFQLAPRSSFHGGCLGGGDPPSIVNEYAVEVPASFAVPMLTGWRLGEPCHDNHVRQIGAYIDHFSFVPNPNGTSGMLHYTVVSSLTDNDGGQWDSDWGSKVTILGLTPTALLHTVRLGGGLPDVGRQ